MWKSNQEMKTFNLTQLPFQRLVILLAQDIFKYELFTYSTSLFNIETRMLPADKSAIADGI